ncbi:hypothetical protein QQZ08_006758 [Neonectria magnoliae]|uniref:Uncharacterized protein n=1 Tax=Neonectria magnoliae TaxID=2732573 RepID=A0ABR1I1A0_9HYPO
MAPAKPDPVKNNEKRRPGTPIVKKSRQATASRNSRRLQGKPPEFVEAQPKLVRASQSSSTSSALILPPVTPPKRPSRGAGVEADEPQGEPPSKQAQRSTHRSPSPTEKEFPRDAEARVTTDEQQSEPPTDQAQISTHRSLSPTEKKLPRDAEAGDHPESPPELAQEPPLLSDENSKALQSVFEQVMAFETLKSRPPTLTRIPTEDRTGQTPRTTSTPGQSSYRFQNLAAGGIRFYVEPPGDVEIAIKEVVDANVPEHRGAEIRPIAEVFHQSCLENVKSPTGEDDFLTPLYTVIVALRPANMAIKKRVPWRVELKPLAQKPRFNTSYRMAFPELVSTPSLPAELPADLKERFYCSKIKTPHPDLFIGLQVEGLISALSSEHLDSTEAREFIRWIQEDRVQHDPDGPFEPIVLLSPANLASGLGFPFLIIEGKAYSTGQQLFEAENQAAVALACAHKILFCLDSEARSGEQTENTRPRVLFSLTTQGPVHELWAHWTVVRGGRRAFESMLWGSWNAALRDRAEEFIVKLNNVLVWGMGPFMESVVENLGEIAKQAAA